jgi:hypothetical protein
MLSRTPTSLLLLCLAPCTSCSTVSTVATADLAEMARRGELQSPITLQSVTDARVRIDHRSSLRPHVPGSGRLPWTPACKVQVSDTAIKTASGTIPWSEMDTVDVKNPDDGATVAAVLAGIVAVAAVTTAVAAASSGGTKAKRRNKKASKKRSCTVGVAKRAGGKQTGKVRHPKRVGHHRQRHSNSPRVRAHQHQQRRRLHRRHPTSVVVVHAPTVVAAATPAPRRRPPSENVGQAPPSLTDPPDETPPLEQPTVPAKPMRALFGKEVCPRTP